MKDSYCHVFTSHAQAQDAIRSLSQGGFDMKNLSLMGKGYHTESQPMGFYTAGDHIKAWGVTGAFWGGIWGLLTAPAVFFLPGLGMVALAGPIVSALLSALEGAAVGGASAISAALLQVGVPKHQTTEYETAFKADKFLLLVHGSVDEVLKAHSILTHAEMLQAA